MVTQLLQAALFDALKQDKSEQLAKDAQEIVQILGSSGSILRDAWRLTQSKNVFFSQFLNSLSDLRNYKSDKTELGKTLASFRAAGPKYERVLVREMQTLLLAARGEDSPIVQIATEAELDTSILPGVPEITVQRSLLGGARIFHNGTLKDNSWRARLTKILSVVS